jgi:hypothetical protein
MSAERRVARCGRWGKSDRRNYPRDLRPRLRRPLTECHACYRKRDAPSSVRGNARSPRWVVTASYRVCGSPARVTAGADKLFGALDDVDLPEEQIHKHIDRVRPRPRPIQTAAQNARARAIPDSEARDAQTHWPA